MSARLMFCLRISTISPCFFSVMLTLKVKTRKARMMTFKTAAFYAPLGVIILTLKVKTRKARMMTPRGA